REPNEHDTDLGRSGPGDGRRSGALRELPRDGRLASGGTLSRQGGLQPNALQTILLTFPSRFFPLGEYRLTLEGVRPDGGAAELGSHPFRVIGSSPAKASAPPG
ncbi:MAG: hypothetical protein M3O15_13035, partial [Acidobacteriota bacterium]|nr:hypothetical protein [Acidobacteriota bacterium]